MATNPPLTTEERLSKALYALSTAVELLDEAEFPGTCSETGDCHNCAWDSGRDWVKHELAKLRLP